MVKKRYLVPLCALACALSAMFSMPARAAIEIDGVVGNLEWAGCAVHELVRAAGSDDSLCAVTSATVRSKIEGGRVYFGFTAHAPDVTAESPVGAAFYAAGRMIARWQQGAPPTWDTENYSLRGAASIQDLDLGSFSFEIELGCKNDEALQALRDLQVELYDARGMPSRRMACPIVLPETNTTTTTTRTTAVPKETTTKAPTTTREPATKPSTTTRTTAGTTVKATTAAKTTGTAVIATTLPSMETAPVPPQTAVAPTQAAAAPQQEASQVIWYTVVVTETTADLPLWIEPPTGMPVEDQTAQTDLTAQKEPEPASQRSALLYGTAALLFALAAALVVFWLRTQKTARADTDSPLQEDP